MNCTEQTIWKHFEVDKFRQIFETYHDLHSKARKRYKILVQCKPNMPSYYINV